MFLLQNRPRPWMGDLKKQQGKRIFQKNTSETWKRRTANAAENKLFHYKAHSIMSHFYNVLPMRTPLELFCPLLSKCLGYHQEESAGISSLCWGLLLSDKNKDASSPQFCTTTSQVFSFYLSLSEMPIWEYQNKTIPVNTNCLLGGLLQVSESHGHWQVHTGCSPRTERCY